MVNKFYVIFKPCWRGFPSSPFFWPKLGIYKDFTSSEINDFKQYNLIYGWNGSGKSTLSRLFSSFCGRSLSELYNNFKVSMKCYNKVVTVMANKI